MKNEKTHRDDLDTIQGHPICIDAFRAAGRDCFALIFDTAQLLKAYDIPSGDFISEVFSTTNRLRQLEIIIEYIGKIRETEAKMAGNSTASMILSDEIIFPPLHHRSILADPLEDIEVGIHAEDE